jgi:hypothetical protein
MAMQANATSNNKKQAKVAKQKANGWLRHMLPFKNLLQNQQQPLHILRCNQKSYDVYIYICRCPYSKANRCILCDNIIKGNMYGMHKRLRFAATEALKEEVKIHSK